MCLYIGTNYYSFKFKFSKKNTNGTFDIIFKKKTFEVTKLTSVTCGEFIWK